MKLKTLTLILLVLLLRVIAAHAGEGMWVPMLLDKYTMEDMKDKGFKLSAEDIYSANQASMKDAVMIFNGGCTAELISDDGLVLTNHHCGYSAIQSHSTVENDYLKTGFWAMSQDEELPNPGMTVKFLVRMEEVTEQVLDGVTDDMRVKTRENLVENNIEQVKKQATQGSHYTARVEPFYFGNQYILFVNETYKDIRLVGAPPSAIGKFGGDTDNWMWPRHSGDFSLFRIYADKNNEPAEYSDDNVPFEPQKHFEISLKGYKKGDFTMVFGYPGSTHQYYTSWAVEMEAFEEYPHRINIRDKKLDIMKKAMNSDSKIRIQYASKQSGISNSWKKWKGILRGLKRLDAIEKKEKLQQRFREWVSKKPARKDKYGGLLDHYKGIYRQLSPYNLAYAYAGECGYYLDPSDLARKLMRLNSLSRKSKSKQKEMLDKLLKQAKKFFEDYHKPTDKKIFARTMQLYVDSMDSKFRPSALNEAVKIYNGDMQAYADDLYQRSALLNKKKLIELLKSGKQEDVEKILNDPVMHFFSSLLELYRQTIMPATNQYRRQIDSLNRIWIKGLKTMQEDKTFWPDANFTLRVAYGQVKGYKPKDAVEYRYYTTMEGIKEKYKPDAYDYDVPQKLLKLYKNRDFGRYAEDGEMHVCFIASNHTSGGNSGSPVINGNGNLIGLNFDRNWEGTMSDIMYDPTQCRNISVDIRYILFVIDKYADADHLIEEMDIVE